MRQSSTVRSIPRSLTAPLGARRKEGPPSPAFPGAHVFVVDDDASVRKSLDRLLSAVGYRVQTFESAREFLARPAAPADGPQCLILDIRMPGVSGLDLQMSLRSSGVNIPIIFSTGFGDVASSVRAMKIGAIDFLTKPIDEEELLAAVERGLTLDAEMARVDALMGVLKTRQGRLTPRENQVFSLVVTGMLNKQIAGRLGTCERTIKVHRARIMKKMEAGSVADLVRMADRLGVPPTAARSSEARGMALT
jgi:FixJ family two-component response regulator